MRKMSSLKLLMMCFVVTLAFTNCQTDSSKTESSDADKAVKGAETAELVEVGETPEVVKTPEDIARAEIAGMPTTTVEWEKKEHDFGDINRGEKQTTSFVFKNTGTEPLVIASAKAGCGCTVPQKPDAPILPGETGEITVEYNGSGKGAVTKFVDVILNTESQAEKLTIKTNVNVPEGE